MQIKHKLFLLVLALGISTGTCYASIPSDVKTEATKSNSSDEGYRIVDNRIECTGEKPVVVDLYATWCKPSKKFSPVFQEVKEAYDSKAIFISIDADKNWYLCQTYGIKGTPTTLVILPNGRFYTKLSLMSREQLESFLRQYINL